MKNFSQLFPIEVLGLALTLSCFGFTTLAQTPSGSASPSPAVESRASTTQPAKKTMEQSEYERTYGVTLGDSDDRKAIQRCLTAWGKHPFSTPESRKFRPIRPAVTVIGIGAGSVSDHVSTDFPQLVLIYPSVKVMSKDTYELMNPNGWYCFKSNVTVLSKNIIRAACDAKIADSRSAVAVMGKNDKTGKGGVTVLGKLEIKRVGC